MAAPAASAVRQGLCVHPIARTARLHLGERVSFESTTVESNEEAAVNTLSQDRWISLWRSAQAKGDPLPWYKRLASAYAEPNRHYHNQRHIAECLREFDAV